MSLIQLSGIFAMWELAKFSIGMTALRAAYKKNAPELLGVVLFMELPYIAWAIWLLFHDVRGCLVMWAIAIFRIVFEVRKSPRLPIVFRIDCLASAAALLLIFLGRL